MTVEEMLEHALMWATYQRSRPDYDRGSPLDLAMRDCIDEHKGALQKVGLDITTNDWGRVVIETEYHV